MKAPSPRLLLMIAAGVLALAALGWMMRPQPVPVELAAVTREIGRAHV